MLETGDEQGCDGTAGLFGEHPVPDVPRVRASYQPRCDSMAPLSAGFWRNERKSQRNRAACGETGRSHGFHPVRNGLPDGKVAR